MSRPRKLVWGTIVLLIVVALFAVWYLRSDALRERVGAEVIASLEAATGGKVEMGSFQWSLSHLSFEIHDLTIHGLEPPGEAPFVHVERADIRAEVLSLVSRRIVLRHVALKRPVIHVIVHPDDSTNTPVPLAEKGRAEALIELSVGHMQTSDGQLLLNAQAIPLDVNASDVTAELGYHPKDRRYDVEFHSRSVQIDHPGWVPIKGQADARLNMWPGRIEVKAFQLTSGRSHLEFTGSAANLANPEADIIYKASLDAGEAAAIVQVPGLRSGSIEVSGQAAYAARALSSVGKVIVKNGEWRDSHAQAFVHGGAQFTANRDRIILSSIFATALGGTVNGAGEIRGWSSGNRPAGAGAKEPAASGVLNLRVNGLQLHQLVDVLGARSATLRRVAPAGSIAGTLRAQWTGSLYNLQTAMDLDVVPPAAPTPDQLPVTARVKATYHRGTQTIDVPQLNLATRTTRVDATGVLGSTTADLRVAVNSTDLSDLAPVLALVGSDALPAYIHGRASFTGTIAGKLAAPVVSGHLEATDFDSVTSLPPGLALPPSPKAPEEPVRMHWDLLRVDILHSSTQSAARHGLLRRGPANIEFDGTANSANGKLDANTPFTLRSRMANLEISDLQALLRQHYPVTSRLSVDVNLTGTVNDLRGSGHLQATDLTIAGEPFSSLRANLGFAGREAQLNNLVLAHDGVQFTGAVAYAASTHAFRFGLRGNAFELAKLQRLQSARYQVNGVADLDISGSGTLEEPVLNGALRVTRLVVNGEQVGDVTADAVTRGADLQINARVHSPNADLAVEGSARMREDWPANLRVHFERSDIDPLLLAYLQGQVTGHSAMTGFVYVKGPLRRPRDLNINGTIDEFSAEISKMRIGSSGPIRFSMANEVFTLERFHLVAEGTDLTASGTVRLGGTREMNLRADGRLNMRMLQTFDSDLTSYGTTDLAVGIGGSLSRPDVTGQITIHDAGISFIDLANGLSHVNGTLVFNENRLRVRSLTAQTGGGTLDIGGFISYAKGLLFNLTAKSSDIRLRYPAGVSSVAKVDLRYVGSPQNSRLSGDVEITRFSLNSRFDLAQYLERFKQAPAMPVLSAPLNNLHLDVHITSSPEVQVQTASAKLSGTMDLRLRGTATRPVLLGRVNVLEGNVAINGTKYHIERGDVTFSNPTHIQPVINVEATARIRDYDISLGVHGEPPPGRLVSTYRSDPPLPTADIIALLALGRTKEESVLVASPTQNYTESASSAILEEALSATVSSRSQKLFGLNRIKIDPQAGGPESNPNARATIEQQVSDKVTLTFITNLSQSSQQIVQVEYQVNRNLTVIAVRDQNGVVSFDVRYRQRKR
ncbi:MAG TPA: translocation/assembly module TamB domain-containing protein [Terriglobales bacterium]|nr:translocation/assembly module TamB domain-containing protein [Terriglobales bacterium]